MQRSVRVSMVIGMALAGVMSGSARAGAADQTVPGAGNAEAARLSGQSPMVQSAYQALLQHVQQIRAAALRTPIADAIGNPGTCVAHRAGLDDAAKTAVLNQLAAEGLVSIADDATFPGGLKAGIFPPVLADGSPCPQLPQPFSSAPGSVYGGHHSYPGGLPIHESFNLESSLAFANGYRLIYGNSIARGIPFEPQSYIYGDAGVIPSARDSDIFINQDVMIATPLWHDWAKAIVFQWNLDGSEFAELNFGGTGVADNYGTAGDSRTGAHHILGVAETIVRGLSPELVISQASAHSTLTSGNEYKVVNWIRAAAIIARVDPVAKGYLYRDSSNQLRLPPLGRLGDVNLTAAGQPYVLAEYELHNLSDADSILTGPAVSDVEVVLKALAPAFGVHTTDADYNTRYRNPVLSYLTAERLLILYSRGGLTAVRAELMKLRERYII
jgi:hypothetical protein